MTRQHDATEFKAFARHLADLAAGEILPRFRTGLRPDNKRAPNKPDGIPPADGDPRHGPGDTDRLDPVTEADRAAEQAMRAAIRQAYPNHGIIGEEYGADNIEAEYVWILDPIDGTKAYITGFAEWGTLIALSHRHQPILGLVNQPSTRDLYIGDRRASEWHRNPGHGSAQMQPLSARPCQQLSDAIITSTSPRLIPAGVMRDRFHAVEARTRLSRYGGDCIGYCMLAAGHTDLVIEAGLKRYDIAALLPILEGAGATVTDWRGGDPLLSGNIIAAGDARVHAEALDILKDA